MEKRKNAAVCWRADAPQVNPPGLPGSFDVCAKCGARIYVADRTRAVVAEHPGMVLLCHICVHKSPGEKRLIYPTKKQRRATDEMDRAAQE